MDQKTTIDPKKPSMGLLVVLSIIIIFGFLTGLAEMYRGKGRHHGERAMHGYEKNDHMVKPGTEILPHGELKIVSATIVSEGMKKEVSGDGWSVRFSEDMKVAGKICNRFSGSYTLTNGVVSAPQMIATKMACIGDAMTVESAFFDALSRGVLVQGHKDGQTTLYDEKTKNTFVVREM